MGPLKQVSTNGVRVPDATPGSVRSDVVSDCGHCVTVQHLHGSRLDHGAQRADVRVLTRTPHGRYRFVAALPLHNVDPKLVRGIIPNRSAEETGLGGKPGFDTAKCGKDLLHRRARRSAEDGDFMARAWGMVGHWFLGSGLCAPTPAGNFPKATANTDRRCHHDKVRSIGGVAQPSQGW